VREDKKDRLEFSCGINGFDFAQMSLNNDGNVGIGTTDPETQLHIKGTQPVIRLEDTNTNLYSEIYADTGDGDLLLIADKSAGGTNPMMSFRIGGGALANEKLRINSDGNVGIKHTDPKAQLHLYRDGPKIRLEDDGGAMAQVFAGDSSVQMGSWSDHPVRMYAGGNEAIRIDSAGKVGIGTTSPDYLLDLEQKDGGVQLQMGRTNTAAGSTWMGADSSGFHLGVGAYGTGNSVAEPNGFTVDTSGNVGIGITSPKNKLSVICGTTPHAEEGGISLHTVNAAGNHGSNGPCADIVAKLSNNWKTNLLFKVNKLDSNVAPTEAMRITSSGNVGINDTNPSKKLSVAGDAIIGGDLTVTGTTITQDTETLLVQDKNIILGSVESQSPTDDTANGGGIVLKGATDKSILYDKGTESWN
jgi:hypothetical protein